MTDRVRHLTVTLDRDVREDDVEHIVAAIRLLRYVADVSPIVVTVDQELARMSIRRQIEHDLYRAMRLITEGGADERTVETDFATITYKPRKK